MSQFEFGGRQLALQRLPATDETSPLQAWDAADSYLLQEVAEHPVTAGPVIIMNDSFGALSCALAEWSPVSVSDSWVAQQAARINMADNDIDETAVTLIDSLAPLPQAPKLVLIKLPKQLALLEHQLRALREVVTPETRVIIGAKARDIHSSTLQLIEKLLGPTTTSLAWKKARLVFCTPTVPALAEAPATLNWKLEGTDWTIHNHANVFSRSGLDIGARFLLEYLPSGLEGELIDLGCGNGVLGLKLLDSNPQAQVTFVDESYMAVASSELNVAQNMPEAMERCEFVVNHSLSGMDGGRYNAVFCNPPFHQEHALTDGIAWQMFNDARRCLGRGGELWVVGNRHLDYYRRIRKVFGNCTTVATNKKFVILKATKLAKMR
ncbi:ribosomal RNA large subunit methyltransferase G [Salmonella enterica subsp. enterica serovar Choleraesuis]|nr:ribosomal RNA large subunit methyltransferase G [Salmonella enterica subsp. enterica serovar Choleraesuis]